MEMTRCASCTQRPSGECGHRALVFQLEGPFPGHHIFRCSDCGERWIRHYGSPSERHAWMRYNEMFSMRTPKPDLWRPKVPV